MDSKYSYADNEESEDSGLFTAMLIAAAVGAAIAILLAPKSGKETREQIKDLAGKQTDNLKDQVERTKAKAQEAVSTAKDKYSQVTEQAKNKLESFTSKEQTNEPGTDNFPSGY